MVDPFGGSDDLVGVAALGAAAPRDLNLNAGLLPGSGGSQKLGGNGIDRCALFETRH
jgi:hypothetical protein